MKNRLMMISIDLSETAHFGYCACVLRMCECIGRSRGSVLGTRHPLWDPILSFSHTFSPKGARVGGPCPPNGCTSPPTGNPGSATGVHMMSLLLTADVTFGYSQNHVTVATLPHTAVVFRMQPFNFV